MSIESNTDKKLYLKFLQSLKRKNILLDMDMNRYRHKNAIKTNKYYNSNFSKLQTNLHSNMTSIDDLLGLKNLNRQIILLDKNTIVNSLSNFQENTPSTILNIYDVFSLIKEITKTEIDENIYTHYKTYFELFLYDNEVYELLLNLLYNNYDSVVNAKLNNNLILQSNYNMNTNYVKGEDIKYFVLKAISKILKCVNKVEVKNESIKFILNSIKDFFIYEKNAFLLKETLSIYIKCVKYINNTEKAALLQSKLFSDKINLILDSPAYNSTLKISLTNFFNIVADFKNPDISKLFLKSFTIEFDKLVNKINHYNNTLSTSLCLNEISEIDLKLARNKELAEESSLLRLISNVLFKFSSYQEKITGITIIDHGFNSLLSLCYNYNEALILMLNYSNEFNPTINAELKQYIDNFTNTVILSFKTLLNIASNEDYIINITLDYGLTDFLYSVLENKEFIDNSFRKFIFLEQVLTIVCNLFACSNFIIDKCSEIFNKILSLLELGFNRSNFPILKECYWCVFNALLSCGNNIIFKFFNNTNIPVEKVIIEGLKLDFLEVNVKINIVDSVVKLLIFEENYLEIVKLKSDLIRHGILELLDSMITTSDNVEFIAKSENLYKILYSEFEN